MMTGLVLLCSNAAFAQSAFDFRVPFPSGLQDKADTVSMVITGDVMMHARQMEYDHSAFLQDLVPLFKGADFALANMEFSLGGRPYSGYPAFSVPDSYAEYVRNCGVNVFLTANNHILDRGAKGLDRTLRIYDSLGVRYCGTARDSLSLSRNSPLMLKKNGISIALVNFTYGTNASGGRGFPHVNLMDRKEVRAAIRRAREMQADFIVALPHWGTEYRLNPDKEQREWAEWLVEEGVDVIVGSHPHVVQDSTHIKGKAVFYSLGNCVSNMSATNTRIGLCVRLEFVKSPEGKHMPEPEVHFTWCTLPGMLTDNYSAILIKKWASRRNDWLTPSDFDNMTATLERVVKATSVRY